MGVFEDFKIGWDGREYLIPSDRVMGAINRVERVVTLKEIYETSQERGTLQLSVIAAAYASLLRYAGADVKDEEVYVSMFKDGANGQRAIMLAVQDILSLMVPPARLSTTQEDEAVQGKSNRRSRRAAASTSRRLSRRPEAGG